MIKVNRLYKSFGVGESCVDVLKDINLSINKGEFLVILGESGGGKSTLLNIISGLDKATSGSVLWGELDIQKLNEKQLTEFRKVHMGFVFQYYNLIPTLTVLGYSNCRILKMCLKETLCSLILSIVPSIAVSVVVCYVLGKLMSNDFYTSPFVIKINLMIYPLMLLAIISTVSILIYYYNIKSINTADVIKIKE